MRRGFTLIELLVVIAIVGLLIAILLPALGAVRTRSRETLSLNNARTIATTFEQYASGEGSYPFPTPSERINGGLGIEMPWWPEGTLIATSDFWSMSVLWPGYVASVAPWPENFESWISPGLDTELPAQFDFASGFEPTDLVSYSYSNSFLARPALWAETASDAPEDGRGLLTASRPDQVRFPSGKSMIWDRHLAFERGDPAVREGFFDLPTPIAFADGHAAVLNPLDASGGWVNGISGDTRRLHNTPMGIEGTDF